MSAAPTRRRAQALAACLLAATAVQAHAAALSIQTEDLNGKRVAIPSGLPAEPTLLLVGFRHGDRPTLDGWRQGLRLSANDPSWLETPIIGVKNGMLRHVILNGMRRGADTPAARAHLAPAFTDPKAVAAGLGVDGDQPAAVVVDRTGRVLARASGAYDPAKARPLVEALRK